MKINNMLITIFGFLVVTLASFFVFSQMIPKAPARLRTDETATQAVAVKNNIRFVAIGDSLTEGVGDETTSGGYVPLVASTLEEAFSINSIEIENYGVAGDRSTQILKRINEQQEIQDDIASAEIISVTVGGNDLMKVIQNNILGLSVEKFEKPGEKYQANLTKLLTTIRQLNSTAPIYVLGIYNPYYIYFPEITEMQTIIDQWNTRTQVVVEQEERMYFVPINDLIYQGIISDEEASEVPDADTLNELRNNAIYEGDNFHPNYNGYQLIAKAFTNKMKETKDDWLIEE
ncbi:MAG: SGNH/GDSL hydrolase family protein [Enterococcus sp.]|nr:SGNH/GDSL hydrolase family protein [Enterococcus sp.]MBP9521407.1 SGNH/GDSL hydrolase family protein [Enterococcus sp.]